MFQPPILNDNTSTKSMISKEKFAHIIKDYEGSHVDVNVTKGKLCCTMSFDTLSIDCEELNHELVSMHFRTSSRSNTLLILDIEEIHEIAIVDVLPDDSDSAYTVKFENGEEMYIGFLRI